MMRAGRLGAVPPGGGAHMSLGLVSEAANRVDVYSKAANKLRRMCLLQLLFDQVAQLARSERRTVHLCGQPAVTADHGGLRSVRDESFFRPVVHSESPRDEFNLRLRSREKSPPIPAGIPNLGVSEKK